MPRKRQNLKTRRAELSATALCILSDGLYPEPADIDPWDKFELSHPHVDNTGRCADLWEQAGPQLLEEWIGEWPGTRPRYWWIFSAPAMTDLEMAERWRAFAGRLREPRRRLGGIGTASYDVFNEVPAFEYGIPARFVSGDEVAFFNGRPRGHFKGVAIDPADPPRFESQAAYLKRFGLFVPGEQQCLGAGDFEPEVLDLSGNQTRESVR